MEYTRHGIPLFIKPASRAKLARLGLQIGDMQATDAPLRWQIPFTYSCGLELVKYYMTCFLEDDYSATNILFFRSLKNPGNVYVQFTPRGSERG